MPDIAYHDDLRDFVRHHKLDAYELTDEEVAQLLELWRWAVWTQRSNPDAAAFDTADAAARLQRQLATHHNIEVEYNTAALLKQEAEPLMHWRILCSAPRALLYFLRPDRWWTLLKTLRRTSRYQKLKPLQDGIGTPLGYPANAMHNLRERAPDLLKRPYWRQLSSYSFEQRKKMDYWW